MSIIVGITSFLAILLLFNQFTSSDGLTPLDYCRLLTGVRDVDERISSRTRFVTDTCVTEFIDFPSRGSITTEEQILHVSAKTSERVWYAIREGSVPNLFNEEGGYQFIKHRGEKCGILAVINIADSSRVDAVSLERFLTYLQETTAFVIDDIPYSYMEYFLTPPSGEQGMFIPLFPSVESAFQSIYTEDRYIIPGRSYAIAISDFEEGGWLRQQLDFEQDRLRILFSRDIFSREHFWSINAHMDSGYNLRTSLLFGPLDLFEERGECSVLLP